MATSGNDLKLAEDDVAFILNLLRQTTSPLTTSQLVEALKSRKGR